MSKWKHFFYIYIFASHMPNFAVPLFPLIGFNCLLHMNGRHKKIFALVLNIGTCFVCNESSFNMRFMF